MLLRVFEGFFGVQAKGRTEKISSDSKEIEATPRI